MTAFLFRDWFFDRLIWTLMSGEWIIKIRDFKNSRNKKERNLFGLTVPMKIKKEVLYTLIRSGERLGY